MLDDTLTRDVLEAYFLVIGDDVEVEIRTSAHYPGEVGPRIVEGTVVAATTRALLIETTGYQRKARIPWDAVASIRDRVTVTPHPALGGNP